MCETKHTYENPDSIEIGTPSKGGCLKLYGDFAKPETFKNKLYNAQAIRLLAQEIIINQGEVKNEGSSKS